MPKLSNMDKAVREFFIGGLDLIGQHSWHSPCSMRLTYLLRVKKTNWTHPLRFAELGSTLPSGKT
jgi:hypothetical protein